MCECNTTSTLLYSLTRVVTEGETTLVPNIKSIKHLAFAVRDARATLATYTRLLAVPQDTPVLNFPKSRNRIAIFVLGDIEYQLCESMDADGRFASWIAQRGAEGLHHICYEVDDIAEALRIAQERGATLRPCTACRVLGSHPHPEGYVAFLDDDAGGIEIEFMQVYTSDELTAYTAIEAV